MERQIAIGFWNYVDAGEIDAETAVEDWCEVRANVPMTFLYDVEKHDKRLMLTQLDACARRGVKAIVRDGRTLFERIGAGTAQYKQGVEAAVKDFGAHPAVFGFYLGDEPVGSQFPQVTEAYKIVKAAAPHLTPFINFLPYWEEEDVFCRTLGVDGVDGYMARLDALVKETGMEILCYDFYGHMSYFDREKGTDYYFKNLNKFGEIARKNDIAFWYTPSVVGHWHTATPTEDDIRWQMSTAIAHGVSGLVWFCLYERMLEDNFRDDPIDLFHNKSEHFYRLARQNRIVSELYGEKLKDLRLDNVRHIGKTYGGTEAFVPGEFELTALKRGANETAHIIVSRFIHRSTGKVSYIFVNADRKLPVKLDFTFNRDYTYAVGKHNGWLAPGQMVLVDLQ